MRRARRFALGVAGLAMAAASSMSWSQAQEAPVPAPATAPKREAPRWPGLMASGAVQLPNGWSLKPAGRQTTLGDFPILLAECPTAPVLAVLHAGYGEHEVITLNPASGKTIGRVTVPATFGGLVWSAEGKRLYVGGGFDEVIYRFDHADGFLSNRQTLNSRRADVADRAEVADDGGLLRAQRGSSKAQGCIAGLALSDDGKTLWAADAFAHRVVWLDAESGEPRGELELGADSYPYGLRLDPARGRLYVSLWNQAKVAVVDIQGNVAVVGHYETQEHPNEMLLLKGGDYLLVANANRNTVTVIDTKQGKAIETIGTAIAPEAPSGSTPNALAVTPDEKVLFVANANTNDVAVVNVETPGKSKPLGLIPVGWYPTCVRVSRDGKTIYVTNGKGSSSRANRDGPNPVVRGGASVREYIAGLFRGTMSTIGMPSPSQMGAYTKTVYECSPLNREAPMAVSGERPADSPIPGRVGDPSPITHCVYIIKENRTYDQIFGDIPRGNGEAALCLFPERVTPNHHALADEYVLLDNFYVESEVSADGHEWTMAAYATDFVERIWPISYRGDKRAPYPAEGRLEIATPAGGYLWDRARAKNVSYFSFGEFVDNPKERGQPATTRLESLQGHFDPLFWGYDLSVTDQERADRFLQVLDEWEQKGEMPRLITLRLPNDHTSGTRPGVPTPVAMVADNDLALGRVVEGLSRSRFWPSLAIFVVEDDAQNGSDHVDAHRTVAMAISPYIRRGTVDSTLYSTSSMLRTMELILGLDPMSQFDAAARPMYASFTATPDLTPYRARPAQVDLKEVNLADAPMAAESLALDLSKEDAADDILFNEIIWKAVRGRDSHMPPPVRAAFVLPRVGGEDEDDDDD